MRVWNGCHRQGAMPVRRTIKGMHTDRLSRVRWRVHSSGPAAAARCARRILTGRASLPLAARITCQRGAQPSPHPLQPPPARQQPHFELAAPAVLALLGRPQRRLSGHSSRSFTSATGSNTPVAPGQFWSAGEQR